MSEDISSNSFPLIQGVDTVKGMAMTGSTADGYRRVLSMFCKDAKERLQKFRYFLFESMSSGSGKFPEKHLSSLTTQVQALKTASATIGAAELSCEAAGLEAAGRAGDLVSIQNKLPDFIEQLTALVANILAVIGAGQDGEESESSTTDISGYLSTFKELAAALKSQNVPDIERILGKLSHISPDIKTKEALEQISDQVLMTEFDSAIKTIDGLIGSVK